MKKLLRSISLLIILSIGLFSCKTASVMKRHYNKGYYVSKTHAHDEIKITEQTVREETKKAELDVPAKELVKISLPDTKRDIIIKDETPPETVSSDLAAIAAIKEQKVPHIGSSFSGKDLYKGINTFPRDLKSALAAGDDLGRDALSLLWILILALLIIYIVGLLLDLFGIGPVFHILGAIVLVLLILWLLRII